MPKEVKKEKSSSFDFFSDIFKYNLRKIDATAYKKVFIFFTVALFLAAVVYTALRINQELTANKKAEPPKKNTQEDKKLDQQTKQANLDQQRKNDVFIINSALQTYFLDKETAPSSLSALSQDFINEIPKDPENDASYGYEPAADRKSWKVSAILSDGSVFELTGP